MMTMKIKNYRKLLFLLPVLLQVCTGHLSAQSETVRKIDSVVKHADSTGIFNGNILVSENSRIIYEASFGFTDAAKQEKLNKNSRFHLGSITKEFSAVALMQLKEKGKLKQTDEVSKFIPELPAWANEMTIKDLLQYSSGLPKINWKNIKNDRDLFNGLRAVENLDFKPGTRYDYNNNTIFLRHFVIEHVTGMPYKAYAEKFIFKPAGMKYSVMTPLMQEKNIATGFKNTGVQDPAEPAITGGTYATARDLMKWADALHAGKIISEQSLYDLGQGFPDGNSESALGHAGYHNKKLTRHFHQGRAGSFEAVLFSDPGRKINIIILSNSSAGQLSALSDAICSVFGLKNPDSRK